MIVMLLRALVLLAVVACVLFGSTGRWDLQFFWAFMGIGAILAVASFLTANPELSQARVRGE